MIDENMTPNRSKTYLFPLLLEFYKFPDNILHLLKNTYIYDTENLHDNCIYLLFQYDKSPEYSKFEYDLTLVNGYVTCYDLKNNLTLYVIKFPIEYLEEYYYFKDSKYSKYKKDAQQIILRYLKFLKINNNIITKIQQIFNKDIMLKRSIEKELGVSLAHDAELGEEINKEKETININKNMKNYYES